MVGSHLTTAGLRIRILAQILVHDLLHVENLHLQSHLMERRLPRERLNVIIQPFVRQVVFAGLSVAAARRIGPDDTGGLQVVDERRIQPALIAHHEREACPQSIQRADILRRAHVAIRNDDAQNEPRVRQRHISYTRVKLIPWSVLLHKLLSLLYALVKHREQIQRRHQLHDAIVCNRSPAYVVASAQ